MTQMTMPRRGGKTARRRALYDQTALDVTRNPLKATDGTIHWYKLWQPDAGDELQLYGPTIRVAFCWSATTGDVTEAGTLAAGLLLDRSPRGGAGPNSPAPSDVGDFDQRWITRHFVPYSGRQLVPLSTEFKLRYLKLEKEGTLYLGVQRWTNGSETVYGEVLTTAGFRASPVHSSGDIR